MLIQAADQFNILSVLVVNLCSEVFTERMGGYILIPRTEPVANLFQMLLHCPDTDRKYQIIALNALRVRIFKAMYDACMNDNVGYCQTHRSIITMLKKYGSMKAIAEKTETDCSNLVRGCIYEATGKDAGNFNTSTEPTALEKTGLFEKKVAVTASTQFKPGDILVTKTKGHTVVVVSVDGSTPSSTSTPAKPAASTSSSKKVESAKSKDAAIAGKYKTTGNLYLRVGAGTGKTAITLMPKGSDVQCYGYYTSYNGTRWYYVAYGNLTGFCSSEYLKRA